MKALKFSAHLVPFILSGEKTSTWRVFDEKDLQVGDELAFVNTETGKEFAQARTTSVREKPLGEVTSDEEVSEGNLPCKNAEERLALYRKYYGDQVTPETIVKMLKYELVK